MFEAAEHGTNILPSVTVVYKRDYDEFPLHRTDGPLGQPRRTDVPTPHSAFVKAWYSTDIKGTITESPVAELLVFENVKVTKKLKIFVWPVEQVDNFGFGGISLHYAFMLQIADM